MSEELLERLDRLAADCGCPRNTVLRALLEGAAGVAEVERLEHPRQRRLPGVEARGPRCVLSFEPSRVAITIRQGGREYRLLRMLFG